MTVFTIKARNGFEALRKAALQDRPGLIARQASDEPPDILTDYFVFERVEDAIGHHSSTRQSLGKGRAG